MLHFPTDQTPYGQAIGITLHNRRQIIQLHLFQIAPGITQNSCQLAINFEKMTFQADLGNPHRGQFKCHSEMFFQLGCVTLDVLHLGHIQQVHHRETFLLNLIEPDLHFHPLDFIACGG